MMVTERASHSGRAPGAGVIASKIYRGESEQDMKRDSFVRRSHSVVFCFERPPLVVLV